MWWLPPSFTIQQHRTVDKVDMKIYLVGSYPPPFGGISIHIKRLHEHLLKHGYTAIVYDLSGIGKATPQVVCMTKYGVFVRLWFSRRSIVHFHNFSHNLLLRVLLLPWWHFRILSFHNERFMKELVGHGKAMERLFRYSLRRMNAIIVSNSNCQKLLEGFTILENVHVIPEFIPVSKLPPLKNSRILHMRKSHRFLISSNASKLGFHEGKDLYGIDMLIEMMAHVRKEKNIDAALIFLLPSIEDEGYFLDLKRRIAEHGLDSHFAFITEPLEESSSLWKISDLVIRATNTDGNSLTVYEAITLGVPTLVSDCTVRPNGVVLFRTRDRNDLISKTVDVLLNLEGYRQALCSIQNMNHAYEICSIYDELGSTR